MFPASFPMPVCDVLLLEYLQSYVVLVDFH